MDYSNEKVYAPKPNGSGSVSVRLQVLTEKGQRMSGMCSSLEHG